MKSLFENFSFFSLRGRVFLLVALFVFSLTVFCIVISFRLNTTDAYNQKIVDTRLPLIKMNKEILHAIDRSMAGSRAFIIIGDVQVSEQREKDWAKSTEYITSIIESTKNKSLSKFALDSLPIKLEEYGKVQSEIDGIVKKHLERIHIQLNDTSVSDTTRALAKALSKQKMLAEILDYVNHDVESLENSLLETANLLLEEQEELLANELAMNKANITNTIFITFLISLIACVIGVLTAYFISKSLLKAVNNPSEFLNKLAKGEMPKNIDSEVDEMKAIVQAGQKVKDMLQEASQFSTEVGKGNFEYQFKPVSTNDLLGNSLVNMRTRLNELSEEERRRNWISSGIAKFVTILRNNNSSIQDIGEEVLAELIKYIGANQGGLFVLNDANPNEQFLEMTACIAYDRKKFLEKKLKVGKKYGEGLVGQVFLEKETVQLKELPESYIKINSGLGEIIPNHLVLVPLKLNDDIQGVLEIASLNPLESYKVEFVEKIGENLSSTIITLKNYSTTQKLLAASQEREEELRTQEEEMRQNVEELSATQEEMGRKQSELEELRENLEKELEKSKGNEERLKAQEEEMQQNVEELSATQEEMTRKQTELVNLKENLEKEVAVQTESLTLQKENFMAMASAVPGMIFQLQYEDDNKSKFTFISEGVRQLTGKKSTELTTLKDFEELIEEDSVTSLRESFKASVKSNSKMEWEGCMLIQEDIKWIRILAQVTQNKDGFATINGIISDISASKEEQEQFKMQNMMLAQQEEAQQEFLVELSKEKSGYLEKIAEIESRNAITENTLMELGNTLIFEIDANIEELNDSTPLWHTKTNDKETNAKNYGEFFSSLLIKDKVVFDKALKDFFATQPENTFEWRRNGKTIKISEESKGQLIGIVQENTNNLNDNTKQERYINKPIIGQIELVFNTETGKIAINTFDDSLKTHDIFINVNSSFDVLQSVFVNADRPFATFIYGVFKNTNQEISHWKGQIQSAQSTKNTVEFTVLNKSESKNKTIIGTLIIY